MPRLFCLNPQFEQQLASHRQTLPAALARRAAELSASWLSVCSEGDGIWCPEVVPESFRDHMASLGLPRVRIVSHVADLPEGAELHPWGWSPTMRRFARQIRAHITAPAHDAVVRANSRRFSFELEQRWNCGLPRATPILNESDLEAALRSLDRDARWVIKAEFSSAARERLIGRGPQLTDPQAQWIRKRLSAGNWLCFEPWVDRIAEAGLQWTVPESGSPVLEGVTVLHTDEDGQYTGSGFGLAPGAIERWQPAIQLAREAVLEIQRIGYHGPVGIDAMLYRDGEGQERLRALQDINARWTMGRLALGWRQIMPRGVWRHGSADEFARRQELMPEIIRTSPESVGGRPTETVAWLEPNVM